MGSRQGGEDHLHDFDVRSDHVLEVLGQVLGSSRYLAHHVAVDPAITPLGISTSASLLVTNENPGDSRRGLPSNRCEVHEKSILRSVDQQGILLLSKSRSKWVNNVNHFAPLTIIRYHFRIIIHLH